VGSTGSPLTAEAFTWVRERLGADTWLFSCSGGTEVCSAFVGGVPTLPVHAGEIQARSLGARVEAWDDNGAPLTEGVGELVVTAPMPSMPLRLWNDPGGALERESYFSMYPGTWRHGDWAELTDRGSVLIHGRSDATINRGGVRIGTAEIYRAVLDMEPVVDALVVEVPRADGDGSWMPLFVALREGHDLDDELTQAIEDRVRRDCSPRHVPSEIRAVPEIPRTISGKILEIPVKRILAGTRSDDVVKRDALANPAALDPFIELGHERAVPSHASDRTSPLPTAPRSD
jgi:acetoacetyl-CoA synthetase